MTLKRFIETAGGASPEPTPVKADWQDATFISQCLGCGGPNDLLRSGRVPKYCSDRCRAMAYRRRRGIGPREHKEPS